MVDFFGKDGLIVGGISYTTRNGGTTWERAPFQARSGDSYPVEMTHTLQFVDLRLGFRTKRGSLFGTDDFGRRWTKLNDGRFVRFCFRNPKLGFAEETGPESRWYRTEDGGRTWMKLDIQGEFDRVVSTAGSTDLFTSIGPNLLRSSDLGVTWTRVATLGSGNLRTRSFGDDVWLVGLFDGYCARYSPERNELREFRVPTQHVLLDILVAKDKRVVVGESGSLFVSRGASLPWEKIDLHTGAQLGSVAEAPDGKVFVVGGKGAGIVFGSRVALKSSDLHHWSAVELP